MAFQVTQHEGVGDIGDGARYPPTRPAATMKRKREMIFHFTFR